MRDFKIILASNVKRIRKKKNISQEKLAELASIHRTYVGSIERAERNISLKNIVAIADALEVDPCQLLQDQESYKEE
jgi:transcriptional regulator with XRE-family HTH domain